MERKEKMSVSINLQHETTSIYGGNLESPTSKGDSPQAGQLSRTSRTSRTSQTGDSWISEGHKQRSNGLGLYAPPSNKDQDRKRAQTAFVNSIVAKVKKVTPRVLRGAGEEPPKLWQETTTSQQSPITKKIKMHMLERQLKIKALATNNLFRHLFAIPRGHEHGRNPTMVESTMGSKEEVVAREVIDKTAYQQCRKQQGVWAQLGKPYECLGAPAMHVAKEAPLPKTPYGVDGSEKLASFKFFPAHTPTPDEVKRTEAEHDNKHRPPSKKKKEMEIKHSRASEEMTRMLMKMGLMYFHDLDHVRFPKPPIVVSDNIAKMIKQGRNYVEELPAKMMDSHARTMSIAPVPDEGFILGANGQAIPVPPESPSLDSPAIEVTKSTSSPSPPKKGDPQRKASSPTTSTKSKGSKSGKGTPNKTYPPRDKSLVFEWKKKILQLRKKLEKDLAEKLVLRSDRREQWGSSSPFSAEVANEMMSLLDKSGGRTSPDTSYIWKGAQEKYYSHQQKPDPYWESEVYGINRFYERVCTFTSHQPYADPLLDVLVYFLKNWLEDGGKMSRKMLVSLCTGLARLPEEVADMGRMSNAMPVLQFIAKEIHVSSVDFKEVLNESQLHCYNPT